MTEQYIKIPSTDGIHSLNCKLYIPDSEPIALFQAVHGMTEHLQRYDDFLRELCQKGYLCFIHDHLGHGKSVNSDSELGFISEKDGWKLLVDDTDTVYQTVSQMYPNKEHFLMGHSMGSFVTRLYLKEYGQHLSGYIMMGSGKGNPVADIGLLLTRLMAKVKGSHHISNFIDKMAFGSYNNGFSEGEKAWLTTDESIRQKYLGDKYCTFRFTVSAMNDLIRLNKECNRKEWFASLPENANIFIVSGSCDPVGEHSKGITKVFKSLKKHSYKVKMKLYEDARHEILNDFCREEVIIDIINFLDNTLEES